MKVSLVLQSGIIIFFGLLTNGLLGQTLWSDHNPYDSSPSMTKGEILKLRVDEPVKIEYEFEDSRDLNTTVKIIPDKTITEFLSPADASRSITTKNKGKLLSKNRVQFQIAVNVTDDTVGNVVSFQGSKVIAPENGKQQQQISISGKVMRSDISSDRRIESANVSDLVISVSGAPVEATAGIPLKDENGEVVAKISEAEKQRLIMEYINRVIGESANSK